MPVDVTAFGRWLMLPFRAAQIVSVMIGVMLLMASAHLALQVGVVPLSIGNGCQLAAAGPAIGCVARLPGL